MNINADFDTRAVMHGPDIEWKASPTAGVDRRMIERIGDEVARATTIVRYAPNSQFPAHVHTGGEEFIVLDGVFQDEHGDFPAGSYIRNPPTSRHTPGSADGCTILVKLWQFNMDDRTHVRIDMNKMASVDDAHRSGVSVMPLFQDDRETVRLETWDADTSVVIADQGGIELFVLEGSFEEGGDTFKKHSWLRLPEGSAFNGKAGAHGARVWIKSGHLPFAKAPSA